MPNLVHVVRLAAMALITSQSAFAQAQNYPAKPITIIVPYGPGASTDIETRIYAQKLTETMGQPVLVDFKPGAGTTVGTNYVAKSLPDGHTLLAITASFMTLPALYPMLPFDPIKDFSPITLMSKRTTVFVAYPGTPFRNIPEYVAYTKANPGKVNVGTTGSGGSTHLGFAWLHGLTNTVVTFVHYKSSAAVQADLLAGRVDLTVTNTLSVLQHLKSGKLKLLGLGNQERSPLLPDAIPAADQGIPGYDYSSTYGISGPAGLPEPVLARLLSELVKIAKTPEIIKRVEADGGIMVGSSPAQFQQIIATDIARYKKIAQDNNIKLDE